RQTNNASPGAFQGSGGGGGMMPPAASLDSTNFWAFGLTVTQQLYDFGQTIERYRAAKVTAEAQKAGEVNINEQVALQVRTAFFTARAPRARGRVAKDTRANQLRQMTQTGALVKVAPRPEIDLAQARTDAANARVQLISADNNYLTAKASLNQAMGVQ